MNKNSSSVIRVISPYFLDLHISHLMRLLYDKHKRAGLKAIEAYVKAPS